MGITVSYRVRGTPLPIPNVLTPVIVCIHAFLFGTLLKQLSDCGYYTVKCPQTRVQ